MRKTPATSAWPTIFTSKSCDCLLPAVDEIRRLAVQGGLIRFRQHKRYTSVQFWVMADQVDTTVRAVLRALTELGIHPDERLQVDNLCLGDSASVTLRELQSDQAVFQHQ